MRASVQPSSYDRYTLLRAIGAGGMAELFLAERAGAQGARRRVVLKRILPAFARDPEFREMFVHEARIAMQLTHANIVQVYDFGEAGDTYVLEMEYIEGCDLRALLRDHGPLPLSAGLRIATEILRGLDYAHRRVGADGMPLQIVHRDVSPGNILLSREGEVKLTDFGLSRSRERLGRSVGGVKGTFAFMAPEQAEGRAVDPRADVFAVGAILYATLAGRSPFEAEGPVATLDRVRQASYLPLSQAAPGAPPTLDALLVQALARTPDERFASAAAMREALEGFEKEAGVRPSADALGALVQAVTPTEPVSAPNAQAAGAALAASPQLIELAWASMALQSRRAVAARPPHTQPLPARERMRGRRARLLAVAGLTALVAGGVVVALRPQAAHVPAAIVPAPAPTPAPLAVSAPAPEAVPVPTPAPAPKSKPRPAYLTVSADPWAYVSVDGKRRGTTPLQELALPPGAHEITFENPPLGASRTRLVRLHAGEHKTLIEKLAAEGR
ncbi:MAG TPA: serine/threonine-protein kinase [Polyangia bacterium]|nr:serine/threonine-protein kinase [Polyangia bacterium]